MPDEAIKEQEPAKNQFVVQRVYLKDLSYESPLGAKAFMKQWKPEVNQELNTKIEKVADDVYEVVLSLTITAKLEEETAFIVEVHQAGIFSITGIENEQLGQVLNTVCPQILFPYAREVIDGALVKGTFPPLMLPPINFEALYAQNVSQQQAKKAEDTKH